MINKTNEVVCFGEILWDVLPDRELPGGAPMNVTYHLTKLGRTATLISRIGADERGTELRKVFEGKGIDISNLQTDQNYRTSIVLATPNQAGDMKYQIVEDVAWDYIERQTGHEALVAGARYFVFGSLATRCEVSRNTLFELMEIPVRKVLDINLRAPFINKDCLEYQLGKAQVLKMNEEELVMVSGWYSNTRRFEDKIKVLQDRFQIETIIVTCGAKGAIVNYDHRFYYHNGFKVNVADTIGSGDSFLAAFLSKFIADRNVESALAFGCTVGAFVATQEGGCPEYTPEDIEHFSAKTLANTPSMTI